MLETIGEQKQVENLEKSVAMSKCIPSKFHVTYNFPGKVSVLRVANSRCLSSLLLWFRCWCLLFHYYYYLYYLLVQSVVCRIESTSLSKLDNCAKITNRNRNAKETEETNDRKFVVDSEWVQLQSVFFFFFASSIFSDFSTSALLGPAVAATQPPNGVCRMFSSMPFLGVLIQLRCTLLIYLRFFFLFSHFANDTFTILSFNVVFLFSLVTLSFRTNWLNVIGFDALGIRVFFFFRFSCIFGWIIFFFFSFSLPSWVLFFCCFFFCCMFVVIIKLILNV